MTDAAAEGRGPRLAGREPGRESDARGELLRALAVFAEAPGAAHLRLAQPLGLGTPPGPDDYAEIFLFQLYPYASVYLGAEGWMGGAARDRIAGFWRAVGRTPPAEPDHLTALLGLYVSLREEEALRGGPEATLAGQSAGALLHEHLAPWVFAWADEVGGLATGAYRAWAHLLHQTLARELTEVGPVAVLPAHLRDAPPLPDPRVDGGGSFLDALLAPARSGGIVTRERLALIARELDVGLRAGERRYALEHLLSQEPVGTLRGLADHFERAARGHADRQGLLGSIARHQEAQAEGSTRLLRELALETGESLSLVEQAGTAT